MKVKVEFLEEGDKTLMVETHQKRNETFNIMKSDHIMAGDSLVFDLPVNGRLIVNAPSAVEAAVYDRDQAASISPSKQSNVEGKADAPVGAADPKTKKPTRAELDAELAKLPNTQTDPDYVVKAMQSHWGDVFTADDEKVVRAKVQKRTPPTGGAAKPTTSTTTTPNSAPVHSNESPNSVDSRAPATPGATPNTPPNASPGAGANATPGGNTEKK